MSKSFWSSLSVAPFRDERQSLIHSLTKTAWWWNGSTERRRYAVKLRDISDHYRRYMCSAEMCSSGRVSVGLVGSFDRDCHSAMALLVPG